MEWADETVFRIAPVERIGDRKGTGIQCDERVDCRPALVDGVYAVEIPLNERAAGECAGAKGGVHAGDRGFLDPKRAASGILCAQ